LEDLGEDGKEIIERIVGK